MGWIYFIRSPSLREYVGQTINDNVNVRWSQEKSQPHGRLKQVFEKYGSDKCEFFTIMEISQETHGDDWKDYLNMYEKLYIKERNTLAPNGYNQMTGGGNSLHSEETKKKMSETRMGIPRSDETKKKISEGNMGNTNKLGKPLSDETKKKLSEAQMGKIHSDESKQKMSEAHKGNTNMLGKTHNDETKKKMSDSQTKKTVEQWDGDVLIKIYPSTIEAERQTQIHHGSISKVCKGVRKTAGGYIWKYYAAI